MSCFDSFVLIAVYDLYYFVFVHVVQNIAVTVSVELLEGRSLHHDGKFFFLWLMVSITIHIFASASHKMRQCAAYCKVEGENWHIRATLIPQETFLSRLKFQNRNMSSEFQ